MTSNIFQEVNIDVYNSFIAWYLESNNLSVLKERKGNSSKSILDESARQVICTESHKDDVSLFLIRNDYLEQYENENKYSQN